MNSNPVWMVVLLGMGLGACLTLFLAWLGTEYRKATAKVTAVRSRPLSDGWEARCLDCGLTFRHFDPWEVSDWSARHHYAHRGA